MWREDVNGREAGGQFNEAEWFHPLSAFFLVRGLGTPFPLALLSTVVKNTFRSSSKIAEKVGGGKRKEGERRGGEKERRRDGGRMGEGGDGGRLGVDGCGLLCSVFWIG